MPNPHGRSVDILGDGSDERRGRESAGVIHTLPAPACTVSLATSVHHTMHVFPLRIGLWSLSKCFGVLITEFLLLCLRSLRTRSLILSSPPSCVRHFTMFSAELKRFGMILHISQHGLGVIHGKRRQRPTFEACLFSPIATYLDSECDNMRRRGSMFSH